MTGMVQPDVGPSAKYKENSVDDPVSIISILRGTLSFFPSNSCLPYRFCEMFPTSISFLSFLAISLCVGQLYAQWGCFFFFFLANSWISVTTLDFSSFDLLLYRHSGACAG